MKGPALRRTDERKTVVERQALVARRTSQREHSELAARAQIRRDPVAADAGRLIEAGTRIAAAADCADHRFFVTRFARFFFALAFFLRLVFFFGASSARTARMLTPVFEAIVSSRGTFFSRAGR